MTTTTQTTQKFRILPQPNELIDRSHPISFTFNGKPVQGYKGDTIASALAANGIQVIGRSFKYHRPRGLFAHGHDMNTMVQIGNEVSVGAWSREIEPDMAVQSVNAWPSIERDAMGITGLVDQFLPVGFYYKTFIRPAFMWPTYESVLRRIAGLGKLNINAPLAKGYIKQYLHTDLAIVGADPAGLTAARQAAKAGARVSLFVPESTLGGEMRYIPAYADQLNDLVNELAQYPNLSIYLNTQVMGRFDGNWLFAVRGKRLYKIRTKALLCATGALDQPLIFDNNDLPGIMLGSAVERLIHLYGVTPAKKALVVTANGDGWRIAAKLKAAGVTVMGVVDLRTEDESGAAAEVQKAGIPTFWRHTIVKAQGSRQVTGATITPVNLDQTPVTIESQAKTEISCDLIVLSVGWAPDNGLLYQAGTKVKYDEGRHEYLPAELPDGVFAAGRVTGLHSFDLALEEGDLVGKQALASIGIGRNPAKTKLKALADAKAAEPIRTTTLAKVPGTGKQFVDRDEDVTAKDIKLAIQEGFNSIELLKRYSTLGMGPSQGKWSNIAGIRLTAEQNDWTIAETGTTTSRPPYEPVEMGVLAGQMMEPVKYSPVHAWHMGQGAKMMAAGLWMRPEHYGSIKEEVTAVRNRVGLVDVSTLGKFKLTGPGVPALLNKIYVNKWSKLKVGRVRYGLMCNTEGVIMDDGVTARIGDQEWYMTTTSGGASKVYNWIQWWLQSGWGDGVHLTQVTDGWAAFNLAGPDSRTLLQSIAAEDDQAALENEAFPYMHVRELELAGVPCRVMRIGFTGELSYEIHCPAGYGMHLWEAIMTAGSPYDIRPFGVEAQRTLRLEKGHLIIGQDTDALTNPLMVDMDWAVKLDKADFLGQRMIQRAADNGITEKLVGFKMMSQEILPEEGLQIVQRVKASERYPLGLQILGWLTSVKYSPTLDEIIGLCWLPKEMADDPQTTFKIRREGELLEARVHHGPFVDPSGGRLKS